MVDILIENTVVVTMDKDRRIIGELNSDGAVAIEGDKILDVGTTKELKEKYSANRVIDGSKKVVMPGLIDCHGHVYGIYCIGENVHPIRHMGIYDFITKEALNLENFKTSGLMIAAQRIKFGCTTGVTMIERVDKPDFASNFVESVEEIGSRIILNLEYGFESAQMAVGIDEEAEFNKFISTSHKVIQKWNQKGNGRIQIWLGPTFINGMSNCYVTTWDKYTVHEPSKKDIEKSIQEGKMMRDIRRKYKLGMHTHAVSPMIEHAYKKMDPTIWLGPDVLIAHCRGMTDEELRILSETKSNVAYSPTVYAIHGGEYFHLKEGIDNGVNVGLASDYGIQVSMDLFREMRTTLILERTRYYRRGAIPQGKILEMATIDAAKAIGQEKNLGSIESGKKADLILIDMLKPNLTPRFNYTSRLVYEADGHDVDTVIIDGKIVMENRKLKTIDEIEMLEKAQEEAEGLVERTNLWPFMEPNRPRDYWKHSEY